MDEGSAVSMFERILCSGCIQDEADRPVELKTSFEGESLATPEHGEELKFKGHSASERS